MLLFVLSLSLFIFLTVILHSTFLPLLLVTVITAAPAFLAVTFPVESTSTTLALFVAHVKVLSFALLGFTDATKLYVSFSFNTKLLLLRPILITSITSLLLELVSSFLTSTFK